MGGRRYGRRGAVGADPSSDLRCPDPGVHRLDAVRQVMLALYAVCALAVLREWDEEAQQVQAQGDKPNGASDGHARGGKADHHRCPEVHCPA